MTKLSDLYAEQAQLRVQMEATEKRIKDERGRLAATITVIKRKASTVFEAPNGLAVVVPKSRNRHNERNVRWHEGGKSGEVAIEGTRASEYEIKIWLASEAGA